MLSSAHIEPGHVLHPAGQVVDGDQVGLPVLLQAGQQDLIRPGYWAATGRAGGGEMFKVKTREIK